VSSPSSGSTVEVAAALETLGLLEMLGAAVGAASDVEVAGAVVVVAASVGLAGAVVEMVGLSLGVSLGRPQATTAAPTSSEVAASRASDAR
jgi:HAMP domain-containing protein